jgi:hypothetical protein
MARGPHQNDGSGESPEYNRIFDPEGERAYTNLPENAAQIELRHLEMQRQDEAELADRMQHDAMSRVQFWPDVGKFIIPRENSFAAHLQLVNGEVPGADLHFEPAAYLYFDGVIAKYANRPDLFDPRHPDYARNEAVRDNLAVLRNDIMGIFMDDGAFDPEDRHYLTNITAIAHELADGIRHDRNALTRLFAPAVSVELLGVEGEGAAHAYRHLIQRQREPGLLSGLRKIFNLPLREFGLPVIEATAFSDDALDALSPPDPLCMSKPQLDAYAQGILHAVAAQKPQLPKYTVDALSDPLKAESVEHGRTILDWLKKLRLLAGDKTVEEAVTSGTQDKRAALKDQLQQAVEQYDDFRSRILERNPELETAQSVREGERVAKVFHHMISILAKLEIANSISDTMQISTGQTESLKDQHQEKDTKISDLLDSLQQAMTDMSAADQDLQQDDHERQQDDIQLADQAIQTGKNRRRRRRRQASSSASAKKSRKIDMNIRADDYALGQGVFAGKGRAVMAGPLIPASVRERPVPQSAMEGLSAQQLDAVRSLGQTLAQNTQSATNLTPAQLAAQQAMQEAERLGGQVGNMTNASLNDKLTPDEVALSAQDQLKRERDQRRTTRNNPNRNNKGGTTF